MGFKPRYRRVTVHWTDAICIDGWHDPDAHRKAARIVSRGFLLERNDKRIRLAMSVGDGSHVAEVLIIPTGCVQRVEPA